ncbi:MAG: quercetin dioxygenase-like cupin family protein [Desulforhopalus sp.]|jgi:quercetin dioxygenase-like cupin family protein
MRYKFVKGSSAERHSDPTGEATTFLATGEDTDGRVSIFDSHLKMGNGAPWHFHETDDEIFYIISGEVEFGVDNETIVAKPGDLVIAGPKVHRKFTALADSHLLVVNALGVHLRGFFGML